MEQLQNDPQTLSILNSFKDVIQVDRPRKFLTLIYVFDTEEKKVLLGHKARGFGEGKWNAFGGKFEAEIDKNIQESASRELSEECNLIVPAHLLRRDGILFYQYPEDLQERLFEVHCFSVNLKSIPKTVKDESDDNTVEKENVPSASEEMNPIKWFSREEVPISQMWADDPLWLPQYLKRHLGDNNDDEDEGDEAKNKINNNNHKSSLIFSAAFDFTDYSTFVNARLEEY